MAVVTTNLGTITAYGDAVAAGYKGTKAEWQALMADYATVGTKAAQDAQTAQTAANNASASAQIATTKASEASASATKAQEAADSIGTPDTTLTQSGKAADAKAAGDAIDKLKSDLSEIENALYAEGTAELPYTIVNNSYVDKNGEFKAYSGWDRTDYVDISKSNNFKSSITTQYAAYFKGDKTFLSAVTLTADTEVVPPEDAHYIVISETSARMANLRIESSYAGVQFVKSVNSTAPDTNGNVDIDMDAVIDVESMESMTDTEKLYRFGGEIYYHNGTEWAKVGTGSGNTSAIAEEYDSTKSYGVGDYALHEGILYRAIEEAKTEEFNALKWTACTVASELEDDASYFNRYHAPYINSMGVDATIYYSVTLTSGTTYYILFTSPFGSIVSSKYGYCRMYDANKAEVNNYQMRGDYRYETFTPEADISYLKWNAQGIYPLMVYISEEPFDVNSIPYVPYTTDPVMNVFKDVFDTSKVLPHAKIAVKNVDSLGNPLFGYALEAHGNDFAGNTIIYEGESLSVESDSHIDVAPVYRKSVVDTLNYVEALGSEYVHYIVITDMHYPQNGRMSLKLVNTLMDSGHFAKILNLGDVVNTTVASELNMLLFDNVGKYNGDIIFAIGNHDTISGSGKFGDDELYKALLSKADYTYRSSDDHYNYYYDDTLRKIRFIVWDTIHSPSASLDWVESCMPTDATWTVFLCSHYYPKTADIAETSESWMADADSERIISILSSASCKVGGYLAGHKHKDIFGKVNSKFYLTCFLDDGQRSSEVSKVEPANFYNHQALTIMSVNEQTGDVKYKRIGNFKTYVEFGYNYTTLTDYKTEGSAIDHQSVYGFNASDFRVNVVLPSLTYNSIEKNKISFTAAKAGTGRFYITGLLPKKKYVITLPNIPSTITAVSLGGMTNRFDEGTYRTILSRVGTTVPICVETELAEGETVFELILYYNKNDGNTTDIELYVTC